MSRVLSLQTCTGPHRGLKETEKKFNLKNSELQNIHTDETLQPKDHFSENFKQNLKNNGTLVKKLLL